MNGKDIKAILKRYEIRMDAAMSYFDKSMTEMKKANDEFASQISDHLVNIDVRLTKSNTN